ncbi:MAG: hypothetical protein Fur0037_27110 [Planctomycetota bacterium]
MHVRPGERGFSFVEMLVASSLLGLLLIAIGQLVGSGMDAQDYARRLDRTAEASQALVDRIRLDLTSSVRLYGDGPVDLAWLGLLDLSSAPPRLPGSALPEIEDSGVFAKDQPGSEITGNMLFFAKLAWTDRFQCSSGRVFATDVHRLVLYYLTPSGAGPAPGSGVGLNLVRVASEPLADGGQIDRIPDPASRQEVLVHLSTGSPDASGETRPAVQVVWDRKGVPGAMGTLRQIDPSTGLLSDVPTPPRPAPWRILSDEDGVEEILSHRLSVATVFAPPSVGVGTFGIIDTTGSGFPHGFEIQVIGPKAARQVLLRLAIASSSSRGLLAATTLQSVLDVRDL